VTHPSHLACHTRSVPPAQPQDVYVPTLYKARRVPTKQVVCAICVERTRGRTQELNLGYGVTVWLCTAHASREFQTQRNGRDLVLTLQRLWRAHGCLTAARHKALRAHLAAQSEALQKPEEYGEHRRGLRPRRSGGGRRAGGAGGAADPSI